MVKIPTPELGGQPVGSVQTEAAGTPMMNIQAANTGAAFARDLAVGSSALGGLADVLMTKRENTVMRDAQLRIEEVQRKMLDPEEGLIKQQRASARGLSDMVDDMFKDLRSGVETDLYKGLSTSGREAVSQVMDAARGKTWDAVARHELQQLDLYETEQIEARRTNALSNVALNPLSEETFVSALGVSLDSLDDAMTKGGWTGDESDPAYKAAKLGATGSVVLTRVSALAESDAGTAGEFLDAAEAEGMIGGVELQQARADLAPKIVEQDAYAGAQTALSIAAGGGVADPNSSFLTTIDKYEGGGDYDTLYRHAQNQPTPFGGTKVSEMSLNDAIAFSEPGGAYGQWVKPRLDPEGYAAKNNLTSTPMGRYQIVGSTLRDLVERMGLTGDEKFDAAMQDAMAQRLLQDRLKGASSRSEKHAAIRNEWEGFKKASPEELDAMIAEVEGGGTQLTDPDAYIDSIPDLKTRQRARSIYNAEMASAEKAKVRERNQAVDYAFAAIDTAGRDGLEGTTWETFLTTEERLALGTDLSRIKNWYEQTKAGTQTLNAELFADLRSMATSSDPAMRAKFMDTNLNNERANGLPDTQYLELKSYRDAIQNMPAHDLAAITPDHNEIQSQVTAYVLNTENFDEDDPKLKRKVLLMTSQIARQMFDVGMSEGRKVTYRNDEITSFVQGAMAQASMEAGYLITNDKGDPMREVEGEPTEGAPAVTSMRETGVRNAGGVGAPTMSNRGVPFEGVDATDGATFRQTLAEQNITGDQMVAAAYGGGLMIADGVVINGDALNLVQNMWLSVNGDWAGGTMSGEELYDVMIQVLRKDKNMLLDRDILADRSKDAALNAIFGGGQNG